jgi:hypothetical protein
VYKFMSSVDPSEKQRLSPVISTILKLTSAERAQVDAALRPPDGDLAGTDLGGALGLISSGFGSIWGGFGAAHTEASALTSQGSIESIELI